jgi:hypothetical protein
MPTTTPHNCHATGCNVPVPPKLLMCLKHWRMVPPDIQRGVWRHYRPGQEIDKRPTEAYLKVMKLAIEAVRVAESK